MVLNGKTYRYGKWSQDEHKKFIEGMRLYGKNWSKIHLHIGTRTCPQARSHAQKFFRKLEKLGRLKEFQKKFNWYSNRQKKNAEDQQNVDLDAKEFGELFDYGNEEADLEAEEEDINVINEESGEQDFED